VDLALRDESGADLPWDGKTQGSLHIRGPGVVGRYLGAAQVATDPGGWFDTGDVATMDPLGYVRITDRVKDVIKSGGEWISSIDLENHAVSHPDVAEAAAIAVPHPHWGERPVLFVVPQPGCTPTAEGVLDVLRPHFAKWQLPDDVLVVAEIPHTATGKISKLGLRRRIEAEGYRLPDLR
jgi:fatty-acyl-CoA synthase